MNIILCLKIISFHFVFNNLGLLFRTVENKYFIDFVDKLCQLNSNYSVPKRKKIRKIVKKVAEEKRNSVKKDLESADNIALTTDCWTPVKRKMSFLGITVHFFNGFNLKSLSLGIKRIIGSHTAKNLNNALMSIFVEFGILDKIISITGDNAANI